MNRDGDGLGQNVYTGCGFENECLSKAEVIGGLNDDRSMEWKRPCSKVPFSWWKNSSKPPLRTAHAVFKGWCLSLVKMMGLEDRAGRVCTFTQKEEERARELPEYQVQPQATARFAQQFLSWCGPPHSEVL